MHFQERCHRRVIGPLLQGFQRCRWNGEME
jgi:hypothetical protein